MLSLFALGAFALGLSGGLSVALALFLALTRGWRWWVGLLVVAVVGAPVAGAGTVPLLLTDGAFVDARAVFPGARAFVELAAGLLLGGLRGCTWRCLLPGAMPSALGARLPGLLAWCVPSFVWGFPLALRRRCGGLPFGLFAPGLVEVFLDVLLVGEEFVGAVIEWDVLSHLGGDGPVGVEPEGLGLVKAVGVGADVLDEVVYPSVDALFGAPLAEDEGPSDGLQGVQDLPLALGTQTLSGWRVIAPDRSLMVPLSFGLVPIMLTPPVAV